MIEIYTVNIVCPDYKPVLTSKPATSFEVGEPDLKLANPVSNSRVPGPVLRQANVCKVARFQAGVVSAYLEE